MNKPEPECACFMTDPKTWTRYGGSIEPGSAFEPNPECRVHFTDEERNYALGLDGNITVTISTLTSLDAVEPYMLTTPTSESEVKK